MTPTTPTQDPAAVRIVLPGGMRFRRVRTFEDGYDLIDAKGRYVGPQWWHGRDARAFAAALTAASAAPSGRSAAESLQACAKREALEWAAKIAENQRRGNSPGPARISARYIEDAIRAEIKRLDRPASRQEPAPPSGRAAEEKVWHQPQECGPGCEDHECPYTHSEAWYVGSRGVPYETEQEAEAARTTFASRQEPTT